MSFITNEQREKAHASIIKASQGKVKGENRLVAMREASTASTEQKKAHKECLCTTREIDGKSYLFASPDCPKHGIYKLNFAFERKNGSVEGAGRDGRRKAHHNG